MDAAIDVATKQAKQQLDEYFEGARSQISVGGAYQEGKLPPKASASLPEGFSPRSIHKILKGVLQRIKPSPEEMTEEQRVAKTVTRKLKTALPNHVEIRLMGSVAKGTHLKGNKEMDIFLLFPKSFTKHHMLVSAFHYIRKALAGHRLEQHYAEHPYLKCIVDDHGIDLVPSFKIAHAGELGTAVDRSQLHTKYINRHLSAQQKEDVRLLKQFAKALGIYGAELRVEGFSGYLCELLILQYGSFSSAIENAQNWKIPVCLEPVGKSETEKSKIETRNHCGSELRVPSSETRNSSTRRGELFASWRSTAIAVENFSNWRNASRRIQKPETNFTSPLVVLDPVDKNRNVAAVVSTTSLARFIFAARMFLEKPNAGMFFRKEIRAAPKALGKMIVARKTSLLMLEFKSPKLVEDMLWPQLKKTSLAIGRELIYHGFAIMGYYYWSNGERCLLLYELEQGVLPSVVKVAGPTVSMGKNIGQFIKAHNRAAIHIEHDRLVAIEERMVRTPNQVVALVKMKKCEIGIPDEFKHRVMAARTITVGEFVNKFKEVATDYFLRDLRSII